MTLVALQGRSGGNPRAGAWASWSARWANSKSTFALVVLLWLCWPNLGNHNAHAYPNSDPGFEVGVPGLSLWGCCAGEERRETAGRCLGELVRKMGERVLATIIPILAQGMQASKVMIMSWF